MPTSIAWLPRREATRFTPMPSRSARRRSSTRPWRRTCGDGRDDKRAIVAYTKASEQAGDDPEILEALDRLHARTGQHRELAEVLERRVTVVKDAKEQAELFYRLAKLQIEEFQERQLGLGTLKQALERDPDHRPSHQALEALTDDATLFEDAAEALESVYRAQSDNERLTALFEKRIAFAGSPRERTRIRLDLAKHLEEHSKDPKRAQASLEDALSDDPTDVDGRARPRVFRRRSSTRRT